MNTKQIIIYKILRSYRLLGFLTLMYSFFSPVLLHAGPLTEQEVQAAVETWLRHVTADADPDAIIEQMEPYLVDGKAVAYIAHIASGGFCLCGADDLVLPVYLYNPKEAYYEEHPGYQYVLWEIGDRSKYYSISLQSNAPKLKPYEAALLERAVKWQMLIASRVPEKMEALESSLAEQPDEMELNLTTSWNQNAPYNNSCPMGDGGRCVVGCVATAMAQIMRYWTWPPSGTGSWLYLWDGDQSCHGDVGGGFLIADFSDAYDWSNMPDSCTGGCSQTEQDALAELSREAGVSVEMDYGACGSGISSLDPVDNAFENYFRYDNDAYYQMADISAIDIVTLTDEIQWLRPVEMAGFRPTGTGHAWVVYGYDKSTDPDREFLTNMGHGLDDYVWITYDSIPYSVTRQYVKRVAPEDVVKFVGNDNLGDGSPNNPYFNIEWALVYAQQGATLIFKAGSINTFTSNTLVINKPLILRGHDVTIQKQ